MKQLIIIASFCLSSFLFTARAHAQQPVNPMCEGAWVFNAGVGFGHIYDVSIDLPEGFAFKIALQRGMWALGTGVIALGLETSMTFNSILTVTNTTNRFTKFNIAPRAGWHYGWDVAGLDTYAGMALGVGSLSQTGGSAKLRFYGSFYLGASYFFNEKLGINVETGYAATDIQIGVAYKF